MEPEHGDKRTRISHKDVAAAFRRVGVKTGDTVMLHSSLSSMGTVVGGADAVIDGMLDAVGPTGTVAAPTLCRSQPERGSYVFDTWDVETTPCYTGAVAETLRRRPESVRSDHATHSVAAIGARAVALTANHGASGLRRGPFGPNAFAADSPWERLAKWNAAYCFIGVTFRVNTMVHYVESLIVERALRRARGDRREPLAAKVQGWLEPGVWPTIAGANKEKIERLLAERGIVRYGKIGSATLRCARARPMVEAWLAIVEADPDEWFPQSVVEWLADGQQG